MFYVQIISGVVLILVAAHEVYTDIFQPNAQGSLSKIVGRAVFNTARKFRSILSGAGPLAFFAVIGCWTLVILCGFALIYWAFYPAGFHITVASEKTTPHVFVTCFYLSLEILTTLGIGDIIPQAQPIRFAVASEALIGVLLFTASVSWFVLLYPALARMRTLAKRASIFMPSR